MDTKKVAKEIETPPYFTCPISLQIMKDPVTTVTGITYERECIERWLFRGRNTTCPMTKQSLPKDFGLTPNHTLRRLIQSWCTSNASNGVDRVPTPKAPIDKSQFSNIIQDIWVPQLQLKALKELEKLASESDRNRRCMEEAGVAKAMVWVISRCFKKEELDDDAVEATLHVLYLVQAPLESMKPIIHENYDFIDSVTWVLQKKGDRYRKAREHALLILKPILESAPSTFLGRLKVELFEGVVQALKEGISPKVTKAALRILLETCHWGRNRTKIIEAGTVFRLIELELAGTERRSSELILCILDHLCGSAEGRAELLGHSAGLALVAKRILRISPAASDRAVRILSSICKFSATYEVLQEMLRVGGVTKLCIVLQMDCSKNVKDIAMGVVKMHSKVWKNSPCVSVYFSKYPY